MMDRCPSSVIAYHFQLPLILHRRYLRRPRDLLANGSERSLSIASDSESLSTSIDLSSSLLPETCGHVSYWNCRWLADIRAIRTLTPNLHLAIPPTSKPPSLKAIYIAFGPTLLMDRCPFKWSLNHFQLSPILHHRYFREPMNLSVIATVDGCCKSESQTLTTNRHQQFRQHPGPKSQGKRF